MLKRIATLLLGIGLIGLGALFFIAPERAFIAQLLTKLWPVFLVLAGLVRVAGYLIDRHPRSPVGGMMITAIGGVLLAANLRGEQSVIQLIGNYWFWFLLAYILGRVLRQYTHRDEDGQRPRSFSPGAIVLMLLIVGGGLAANYLAKNGQQINGVDLRIGRFGDLRDYVLGSQLSIEDEPPQNFALLPNSRLIVNNPTGEIEIVSAAQAQASARLVKRIRAVNEGEAKQAAKNIHLQISSEGDNYRLSVDAAGAQGDFGAALIITVPQNIQAGVEIANCSGSVKLNGLRGDHLIRAGENIEVNDNTGRVAIENPRGSVELSRIRGEVELVNVADIRVNLQQIEGAVSVFAKHTRIEAEEITGDFTVNTSDERVIAHRIDGAIKIKADGGAVELEDIGGAATIEATRDVTVRHFRNSLKISSRFGAIDLSTEEGIAGDVKAENEKGRIRVSLPEDSGFRIDAASNFGRVRLRGFKQIDLQHAERSGAKGYNLSDSAPLVSLRTNNGDIQILSSGLALAKSDE